MTDEQTESPREAVSSFELNRNSKGYSWKIKIYTNDIEDMKKKIELMNDWAKDKYGGLLSE